MRRSGYAFLFGCLFAGVLAGCGSPPTACVPGATQPCLCPGAVPGAQRCAADGMTWEACLCAAAPATPPVMPTSVMPTPVMPTPVMPAPMAPTVPPAVANGPAAGAPGVVYRPLAEIVHDFRPTDVGDRFLWISTPHGNAQLHCGEHAIEAARRATAGFDSPDFVCPDTRCFFAHEGGIADPTLIGERVGSGVRLIAYWNAYAGDATDERIAQFFRDLECGEIGTFPAE